jgi:hypothetical protein
MLIAAIVFVVVAINYRGKQYIQDSEEDLEAEAEAEATGGAG